MNIQILEEKNNPLFKRKEITAALIFSSSATPSKIILQKEIAELMKVSADSVEISKIMSEFGLPHGKAWIKIWQEKKIPPYVSKKEKAAASAEAAK